MNRRTWIWTCLTVALAFLQAPRLWAYSTTGAYWTGSWPVVNYKINVSSFPTSAGTQQQIIDAIKKGANHWNFETNSKFTFVYTGTTTISSPSADGTNVVMYKSNKCTPSGGDCIAKAFWWPSTGSLTNFDVVYYGKYSNNATVNWKATDPILFGEDIWGYAAHEFGHALGLGHSSVTLATMASAVDPGATWLRFLTSDDISGTNSLYPVNTDIWATPGTSVTAGTVVSIHMQFADANGASYEFLASANGTSPGTNMSSTDPTDYRIRPLNEPYEDLSGSAYSGENGTLNSSGYGVMTWDTTGEAGTCLHFVGEALQTGWPNGIRHMSHAVEICVTP